MIIDKETRFSDGQAITADAISENVYDRGAAQSPHGNPPDIIGGRPLKLAVAVGTAFNTLTSLTVTLESADDAGLTTNAVVHCTRTLTLAELAANKLYTIGIPSGARSARYLGVRYDVNGTNPSAGTISSYLVEQTPENPPQ